MLVLDVSGGVGVRIVDIHVGVDDCIRATIMGSENRKQHRVSLNRAETREQCSR